MEKLAIGLSIIGIVYLLIVLAVVLYKSSDRHEKGGRQNMQTH
jgi:hypothetical protein